jgi:hypothetical protein
MKKEAQTVTVNADELRRIATWSTLATHITPSIQRVVEFAKRVPGQHSFHVPIFSSFRQIVQWL